MLKRAHNVTSASQLTNLEMQPLKNTSLPPDQTTRTRHWRHSDVTASRSYRPVPTGKIFLVHETSVHSSLIYRQIASWQPANYRHPSIGIQRISRSKRKASTCKALFLPMVSFPGPVSRNVTPLYYRKAAHSKWIAVRLRRLRSSAVPHFLRPIAYIKPTEVGDPLSPFLSPFADPRRLYRILTVLFAPL